MPFEIVLFESKTHAEGVAILDLSIANDPVISKRLEELAKSSRMTVTAIEREGVDFQDLFKEVDDETYFRGVAPCE